MPPIDLRGDYTLDDITKLNDEYFTSSYWLTPISGNLHPGNILRVSQTYYEGSIHDFRIAKLSGVTDLQLVENERMLGDSGYVSGEYSDFFISPHKGASSEISDYDLVFDSIICAKRQIGK
ncbi:hypothetical protein ACTFIY_001128 [Dictyostelium cf. discoideum]